MAYLAQPERNERVAESAGRLLGNPDFQVLCDAWLSDLTDKTDEILALDDAALCKAQGQAMELRRWLAFVYDSRAITERLASNRATLLREGRESWYQSPA